MNNDRRTYETQYSPSGGLAHRIIGGLPLVRSIIERTVAREPLARGDTGSEGIAQLTCHCDSDKVGRNLPDWSERTSSEQADNPDDIKRDCFDKKRLAMTDWRGSSPPVGKPTTGFSESDVGRPPDTECDIGLDTSPSGESETTWWRYDEIRNDCCLTMESTRFQVCQN